MKTERSTTRSLLITGAMSLLLAACGGGERISWGTNSSAQPAPGQPLPTQPAPAQPTKPDDAGAVRFLAQASFGATTADIALLKEIGLEMWLDHQLRMSRAQTGTHLDYVRSQIPLPVPQGATVTMDPLYHTFWRQAMLASDQLRQRVAFALSQITVISAADTGLQDSPHTIASFLDGLADNAFGNYRDILQAVATHPAMGQYLTSLGNRGDNGRTPDGNFAREVMQLFSIGLFELNMDGTQKTVNGAPVETYDMDDIRGLAKVLAGPKTSGAATCYRARPSSSTRQPWQPGSACPLRASHPLSRASRTSVPT